MKKREQRKRNENELLRAYVRPQRAQIAQAGGIKALGTLLEVALPMMLAQMVNVVIPTEEKKSILLWGTLMIACSFAAWFFNIRANRRVSRLTTRAVSQMRTDLFDRSLRLSAGQLDRLSIASLETRLTTDTYAIHQFLGATLRMGVRSILLFTGGVISCLYLSPRLSLVLFFLILPLTASVRRIMRKGRPLILKSREKTDEMVQVIRENIRGIRVSKALDKTRDEEKRFQTFNQNVFEAEIKAIFQMIKLGPAVDLILFSGMTLVLIFGAWMAKNHEMLPGTIMAFLSYFIQITNSLMGLNRMFIIYNRASVSALRIREILSLPEAPVEHSLLQDGEKPPHLPEASAEVAEIEFQNVSFRYHEAEGGQKTLEDISFSLFPGEHLGIMGATGSGKSTVIRLILRQYDIQEGQILIRGIPITKIDPGELRQLFAVVFQNDFLFSGSIRENIDFGRELSDRELMRSAAAAQAEDFIEEKGGLGAEIASKGVNLSGGQKQRLILSRALARKGDILLLDDASSALDFATEARLRKALAERQPAQTMITIAQRISSIRHADQILFLDKGRAIAIGSHEELLRTCLPYREIADMQGEYEEAVSC